MTAKISFQCETKDLGEVLSLLNFQLVRELKIVSEEDTKPKKRKSTASTHPVYGKAPYEQAPCTQDRSESNSRSITSPKWQNYSRSKVQEAILEHLKTCEGHSADYEDLHVVLELAGFSPNSLSPALTHMKAAKLVHRDGQNKIVTLINQGG